MRNTRNDKSSGYPGFARSDSTDPIESTRHNCHVTSALKPPNTKLSGRGLRTLSIPIGTGGRGPLQRMVRLASA